MRLRTKDNPLGRATSPSGRWVSIDSSALQLGVTAATVRRWVKTGKLEFVRVAGVTRVSRDGVNLLSVGKLPKDTWQKSRAFFRVAASGDSRQAFAMFRRYWTKVESLVVALEDIVVPCLVETGAYWSESRILVADEHVVSAVVTDVLIWSRQIIAPRESHGAAAAVTLGGDPHEHGARLCQVCVELAGLPCTLLGPGLPLSDLLAWIQRHRPTLLCCSIPGTVDSAVAVEEVHRIWASLGGGQLILGGAGSFGIGELPPDVFQLGSLSELEAVLRSR